VILAGSGYVDSGLRENLIRELTMFEETGGTVVLVSRTDLPFETVDLDNLGGAQRLASALVRLGYTSFRVLCGEKDLVLTRDRVEGFRRGLAESGIELPEDRVTYTEFSWEGGLRAVQSMDDQSIADTRLLFAANDEMALGAIAGLRGRGIRVPEDIAVAGFDDIRSLRDVVPGLTTVHVPLGEVGREAIARIVGSTEHDQSKIVVATVQLRESTPRLN
jgi:LacI family transcriptional regulator